MRTVHRAVPALLALAFWLILLACGSSHREPPPRPEAGRDSGMADGPTEASEGDDGATSGDDGGSAPDGPILYDAGCPDPSGGLGMQYCGGPVISGSLGVYAIWYGDWADGTKALIRQFLAGLDGSPWMAIDKAYCDSTGACVSGSVDLRGELAVGWELGDAGMTWEDSEQAAEAVVSSAIASQRFPADPGAVFVVFVSGAQQSYDGPCTSWCGWHDHYALGTSDLKIAVVWDPTPCPAACTAFVGLAGDSGSPNGDLAADGMVSVLAHELAESASDPDINAWRGAWGENADMCAWQFGTTYPSEAGPPANVRMGGRDWLVQQNLRLDGGTCGMAP